MLTAINPAALPNTGIYSQGVVATAPQRFLFVSGQVGIDAAGNPGRDIADQTKLAIANVYRVLAESGMDPSTLAKVTVYLTDESLLPGFMAAGAGTLPSKPPAMTLLIVKALAAPPLLIEIEAIAAG